MATKWEILVIRRNRLQMELTQANNELKGLKATPCGLHCSGCGEYLATEADFAKHFTIANERFLNLGNCPNTA